jgi:hypothetical protein
MSCWRRYSLGVALLLCGVAGGCGDASFFFAFRSGIVASDPVCAGQGGSFDLREASGLLVLVVFESDDVVVGGVGSAGCRSLQRGAAVDVSGVESGGQLDAQEIVIR